MFNAFMRSRFVPALIGVNDVLAALLGELKSDDPIWNFTADSDRFTLKEIVAHLMDYDAIWADRLVRMQQEDSPVFVRRDPSDLAIEHEYSTSDGAKNLAVFMERRKHVKSVVENIGKDSWLRTGELMPGTSLAIEEVVTFITIHDAYHTGQIAQWLAAAK